MCGAPWARVQRFTSLPSTNTAALEAARAGAAAGLVVVADHQTAGRGRLGRRWEAPPGSSLLASVLLRPVLAPEALHLCTAAVALAAVDACTATAAVTPGVKWPNDLVVGDRKLAGVLAEADFGAPGGPPGSVAVVVGIGCNITWSGPPGAGGTSLVAEAGRPVEHQALLDAWCHALGPRARQLDDDAGRGQLAADLRRGCVTLGRQVRVVLPAGGAVPELVGRAVDLGEGGQLVVEVDGRRHEVSAADVVHLRPATPSGPAPSGPAPWVPGGVG